MAKKRNMTHPDIYRELGENSRENRKDLSFCLLV